MLKTNKSQDANIESKKPNTKLKIHTNHTSQTTQKRHKYALKTPPVLQQPKPNPPTAPNQACPKNPQHNSTRRFNPKIVKRTLAYRFSRPTRGVAPSATLVTAGTSWDSPWEASPCSTSAATDLTVRAQRSQSTARAKDGGCAAGGRVRRTCARVYV